MSAVHVPAAKHRCKLRLGTHSIYKSATRPRPSQPPTPLPTARAQALLRAVDRNKGLVVCRMDGTNTSEAVRQALEAVMEPRRKLRDKLQQQAQQQSAAGALTN